MLKFDEAEITLLTSTKTAMSGEAAEHSSRLLEMLEVLDHVQNVYSNVDFT